MKIIRFVAVLLFSAAVISFSIMNRESVEVHLPFYSVNISMFLLFFIIIIFGIISASIIFLPYKMKIKKSLRLSKKRISELENEISTLKAKEDITDTLESFSE